MHPFVEKLLEGEKVEFKKLGDVCEIFNNLRKPIKSSYRIKGKTPYYGANNIQDYVEGYTHKGEFVLVAEDGSADIKNYSIQWATGEIWVNNHAHIIKGKECLNDRFLYHYLINFDFIPYLKGLPRAKLNKSELIEIPIPIPSLKTQQKIVDILDKFCELKNELKNERALRLKQYAYYRDKLLSFGDVEWSTLGNIFDVRDGTHTSPKKQECGKYLITSKNIKNGTIDFSTAYYISENDFHDINKRSKVNKNDILFTMIGTVGDVGHVNIEPDFAIKNVGLIKMNNYITSRFIFHFLQTEKTKDFVKANLSTGNQSFLGLGNLRKIPFPIISLEKQKEIVEILDKFDKLTNDIAEGLPREIELREKQYCYYRDLLLDFDQ